MPCAYILYSNSRNVFYKGSSRDDVPESRVMVHNRGGVRSTKSGVPWRLVHVEHFADYASARRRELFFKTGAGRKWIRENLK